MHDLAEGGLAIALAESAFAGEIGFNVQTDLAAAELFAENQSRFLVTVTPANREHFEAKTAGKATLLGRVGGDRLKILTTDDMLDV
ncbi:phosphoribosylformylglycinamidine synthase II, partial [Streptomyces sp. S12]|nr:phosphoribosylformylglycinamidine synthase II [Streptomyces sp. S12]